MSLNKKPRKAYEIKDQTTRPIKQPKSFQHKSMHQGRLKGTATNPLTIKLSILITDQKKRVLSLKYVLTASGD